MTGCLITLVLGKQERIIRLCVVTETTFSRASFGGDHILAGARARARV